MRIQRTAHDVRSGRRRVRWAIGSLVAIALVLSACQSAPEEGAGAPPASVTAIDGTSLNRVSLIPRAAERIGIQTIAIRVASVDGKAQKTVPYSALIYDPDGATSVYTNPEPLAYVKQAITVERISGDTVFFSDGPATGTLVVTVGATELYGIEFGIGEFE